LYIEDYELLTWHCNQEDKVDVEVYADTARETNMTGDDDINARCPIQGCAMLNASKVLWVCCGVIACSKCTLQWYEHKCIAVCPWCGSLAEDMDSFMEMIVPVKNSRTHILSSESLAEMNKRKGECC
jgi:hypothetical protein